MRWWHLLLLPALTYGALVLWIYLTQSRMVYLPDLPSRDIPATPDRAGLAWEPVRLDTTDGIVLGAWFLPAEGADTALLFLHGNAGNRGHRLDSLRLFHDLGLAVLILDYRGYGDSEGAPSEAGTRRDARAGWDYLVGRRGFDPERIVIFGRSLGAAVAARLAADLVAGAAPPRALVLESTFTSVPDLGAEFYPWLPVRLISRLRYDTLGLMRRITSPVLVVHSPEDEIIPFAHGQRLFAAAREPKRFLALRGGHNTGYQVSREAYRDGLAAFLDTLGERPVQPR
jgi:fermentation-respiration switch protein FrsA (DUF1100 family)